MRNLTIEEAALLERRKAAFGKFFEERLPVLADFMERLEMEDAPMVVVEAEKFLPGLDEWLSWQTVAEMDDKVWLAARLTYFIGEYLVQRLGGVWFVNDDPDSPHFAHYVVGRFTRQRHRLVFPSATAMNLLEEPVGRSLSRRLLKLEAEITGM